MLRLKNRRGATMILVGVSLVALVTVMAFALDFGRMYLFRAQVHVSSDAAALAGAHGLAKGLGAASALSAVALGDSNKVEGATPTITTANVIPGRWTFPNGPFTPAAGGNWIDTTNNAVQATSQYTASYTIGRFLGLNTRSRTATSIAVVGSVGVTDCVKPWGMPYAALLNSLSAVTGLSYSLSHNLSVGEVALISGFTASNQISLAFAGNSPATGSGTFGAVTLPDSTGTSSNGGAFDDLIAAYCSNPLMKNVSVGPGTVLAADAGLSAGQLRKGVAGLCNGGGVPTPGGGNNSFSCPLAPATVMPTIKMAIWDYQSNNTTTFNSGTTCGGAGNCYYRVKYIGAFTVTGYIKGDSVTGYFNDLSSSGRFSPSAGLVKRIALVK